MSTNNRKRPSQATNRRQQPQNARRISPAERKRRQAAARKRNRQKWAIRIIALVLAVAMVVTLIVSITSCNRNQNQTTGSAVQNTEAANTAETQPQEERVKLAAVGDIIAHETILNLAQTGNGYDFTSLFAQMKPDIASVDLAIGNVETPLGGGPYTGYPTFNTPDEMGLAVIDTGFDVALQSSNHAMDAGADGVHHGISFWKSHEKEILMTGLHESQAEADAIPKTTVNGITFAVLNYTYGLNGYELPYDEPYLITVMDEGTREQIAAQVRQAKEEADFVIVCPHWGEENQVGEPTSFQRDWAQLFADAGADLILGTHPHVIENVEWLTGANGNRTLCYYSLGNYVSNQQYTDLVLGGMAYLEILKKDGKAVIDEASVGAIPVVTHNDKTQDPVVIQTYYLADYTDDLAAVHDTKLSFEPDFSVGVLQQKAQNVFGSLLMDRIP